MGEDAFCGCDDAIIYVNPGMKFDIEAHVDVKVVRPPCLDTKIGDRILKDLRHLKEVTLPTGLQIIGENWFVDSQVEKVVVPVSVREIQQNAFKYCNQLKVIEFDEGSTLEKIGRGVFFSSGLE